MFVELKLLETKKKKLFLTFGVKLCDVEFGCYSQQHEEAILAEVLYGIFDDGLLHSLKPEQSDKRKDGKNFPSSLEGQRVPM